MFKHRFVELWVHESRSEGVLSHPERIRITIACSWNSGDRSELNEPGRESCFTFDGNGVCWGYLGYHLAIIKKELSEKEFELRRLAPDQFIQKPL